ncbi:MAG TPA: acireductone synthase [Pyrinomonadaceae bacterium]
MTTPISIDGIRGILLDIEGTTTPIAFVHDVLFSYARTHVRDFLAKHLDDDAVQTDIRLLRDEAESEGFHANNLDELVAYINRLIDLDRKSTGLKLLQGKIWHEGYTDGTLRAQVFADVAPAFERWRAANKNVSIFSSGSVLAQKLLFAHTEAGDLTPFINDYFDTSMGKKGEAESYRRIAEAIKLQPNEILFVSDIVAELAAAREAGMKTALSIRPGNQPQASRDDYPIIHSFDEL